jgi:hypothetical protein
MARKALSLLLLIIILLVPGIHKIADKMPPNWFIEKFNDSIIGIVPGGLWFSYHLIVFLEFVGPSLFIIALFQMVRKEDDQRFLSYGFICCYILFIILTFGSFLVQDYDNGFKDFLYFIGIMLVEHFHFPNKIKKS